MATDKLKKNTWTKLSANATQSLTVPNSATEAVFEIYRNNGSIGYTFHFVAEMLDKTITYNQGYEYGTALRNNVVGIRVVNREITVSYFYNDSGDYKDSSTTINLYYR